MKHFSLALAVAMLLFGSCRDAVPNAPQTPETTVQPEAPKYDLAVLEKTEADAKAKATEIENLLTQVDELPAKIKQKKATEIEAIKNDMNSMLVKQRDMIEQFDRIVQSQQTGKNAKPLADNASQTLLPVSEYTAQFEQYAKILEEYKERVKNLNN